jgi:flagellar protein FlgJ
MEINSLRSIEAGKIPLERLAGNTKLSEREKLDEASRQFEAILLRQIFSAAQKPLLAQGLGGSSASASIYQDMITEQLADSVSRSRALGLANSLGSELGRQLGTAETDPAGKSDT